MRADPHDACQYLRRDGVGRGAVHNLFQPSPIGFVLVGIGAKGVNENVHIRQNQLRPSMRSNVAALSATSTPRCVPPLAPHMGNITRCRIWAFCGVLRRDASRPCSIIAVSVIPRRAASRFARSRSSSLSLIVVRICLSIRLDMVICQIASSEIVCEDYWHATADRAARKNLLAALPQAAPSRGGLGPLPAGIAWLGKGWPRKNKR